MEGWDGTTDGRPTDLTRRRWQRFGESGAKLIWGGEAFAVRHDGRANPNQLCLGPTSEADLVQLREDLLDGHRGAGLDTDDLVIGLQLTHSGRYARPDPDKQPKPLAAYPHPVLDRRVSPDGPVPLLSDDDLDDLSARLVQAAVLAQRAGFTFVDVKHCHGYLGHELLSARTREGRFGGDFAGRTRLLRQTVEGIRRDAPGLAIGVRLSAFDTTPFRKGEGDVGEPEAAQADYALRVRPMGRHGGAARPVRHARVPRRCSQELGIDLVCLTAGSPYYNPHIQRPATFPPSDGYQPPEDPLMGVARQIAVTAALKQDFPALRIVGSAYSYLQEWLPNVGQAVVRTGGADFIGLGRMVLSYPETAARRAARPAAQAQVDLPDVQRLHDRPAQRSRVRVLPARPVLHGPPGSRAAEGRRRRAHEHAACSGVRPPGRRHATPRCRAAARSPPRPPRSPRCSPPSASGSTA